MSGTLSFSQGFELSDERPRLTSRTGLGFGVRSETRAETLDFRIGTQILGETGNGADDDFSIENSFGRLAYTRRGAGSELSFSARYSERDLGDRTFAPDPENAPDVFVSDTGTSEVALVNAALEFGNDAPFGLRLETGYRKQTYVGTSDPDLTDTETISADALARFRLTPTRAIRALAGYSVEDEEGVPFDTETTYVGIGFEDATSGGLSYSADVLFDRVEGATTDDGVGLELSVTQERPRGTIGLDVRSRIEDDGRTTSASVRQTIALPTGGLAYSLGVVDLEGDTSLRPRASLTYRRELKSAALSATLLREPSIDGATVTNDTQIGLNYSQEINSASGWSAALSYRVADELGTGADDERAAARITYTRSLTEDWQMNAGVEHIREIDAGGPSDSSNTLFFNIQRDITFGF